MTTNEVNLLPTWIFGFRSWCMGLQLVEFSYRFHFCFHRKWSFIFRIETPYTLLIIRILKKFLYDSVCLFHFTSGISLKIIWNQKYFSYDSFDWKGISPPDLLRLSSFFCFLHSINSPIIFNQEILWRRTQQNEYNPVFWNNNVICYYGMDSSLEIRISTLNLLISSTQ